MFSPGVTGCFRDIFDDAWVVCSEYNKIALVVITGQVIFRERAGPVESGAYFNARDIENVILALIFFFYGFKVFARTHLHYGFFAFFEPEDMAKGFGPVLDGVGKIIGEENDINCIISGYHGKVWQGISPVRGHIAVHMNSAGIGCGRGMIFIFRGVVRSLTCYREKKCDCENGRVM